MADSNNHTGSYINSQNSFHQASHPPLSFDMNTPNMSYPSNQKDYSAASALNFSTGHFSGGFEASAYTELGPVGLSNVEGEPFLGRLPQSSEGPNGISTIQTPRMMGTCHEMQPNSLESLIHSSQMPNSSFQYSNETVCTDTLTQGILEDPTVDLQYQGQDWQDAMESVFLEWLNQNPNAPELEDFLTTPSTQNLGACSIGATTEMGVESALAPTTSDSDLPQLGFMPPTEENLDLNFDLTPEEIQSCMEPIPTPSWPCSPTVTGQTTNVNWPTNLPQYLQVEAASARSSMTTAPMKMPYSQPTPKITSQYVSGVQSAQRLPMYQAGTPEQSTQVPQYGYQSSFFAPPGQYSSTAAQGGYQSPSFTPASQYVSTATNGGFQPPFLTPAGQYASTAAQPTNRSRALTSAGQYVPTASYGGYQPPSLTSAGQYVSTTSAQPRNPSRALKSTSKFVPTAARPRHPSRSLKTVGQRASTAAQAGMARLPVAAVTAQHITQAPQDVPQPQPSQQAQTSLLTPVQSNRQIVGAAVLSSEPPELLISSHARKAEAALIDHAAFEAGEQSITGQGVTYVTRKPQYQSLDAAMAAMRSVRWRTGTVHMDVLPKTDEEHRDVVERLYAAAIDLSGFHDNINSGNKLNKAVTQRYTEEQLELGMWRILAHAKELHSVGATCPEVMDPTLEAPRAEKLGTREAPKRPYLTPGYTEIRQALPDRSLPFQDRIDHICGLLMRYKSAVFKAVEGTKIPSIVYAPRYCQRTKFDSETCNSHQKAKNECAQAALRAKEETTLTSTFSTQQAARNNGKRPREDDEDDYEQGPEPKRPTLEEKLISLIEAEKILEH